jgi:hypothetical protein
MTWLNVQDQDRRLRAVFPEFELVLDGGWMGIWEGPLTPIMRRYRIRVTYFRRRLFDTWTLKNSYASVQVIDPVIGLDPRGTGKWPPHIYYNESDPQSSRLCLYDPEERSWSPEEYIADTIIPWAIDWLFFFERWLDTGEWEGGGRHPERRSNRCPRTDASDPERRDRRDRSVADGFHSLGQRIGIFASLPLMAAASEGYFPRRSWPSWSDTIPAADQLASTLISSPAPPPAAFWPLVLPRASQPASCKTSMSGAEPKSSRALSEAGLAA